MSHLRIRLPFNRNKRPAGKEIAGMQPWVGVEPQSIMPHSPAPSEIVTPMMPYRRRVKR